MIDQAASKNNKTTIALLCTTLNHLGGLAQHILQIYDNLDRSKFRVLLVYYSNQNDVVKQFFIKNGVLEEDLHFVPMNKSSAFVSGMLKLSKLYKKEQVDIVHTFLLHSDILGFFSAKLSGRRFLVSSVEGKFMLDETNGVGKWKQVCYRLLNTFIRKQFSATMTVSKGLRDEVIKSGADPNKVIANPVGIHSPQDTTDQGSHARQKESCVVACVSRFSKDKGIEYFIQAMPRIIEKVPSVAFIIAGKGEEEVALRKLVSEFNLQSHVSFLGWVDDMNEFYKNVDIFVMPSLREGCPLGLLEALSFRKPAVAFNVDGVNEILENGQGGILVEPFNIEAFADATIELCQNRDEAHKKACQGQARVKSYYTVKREINKLMDTYHKTLEGSLSA